MFTRPDGTKWYWTVQPFSPPHKLQLPVPAVCTFLEPHDARGQLVIIKNNRGYDIPGGHLEAGEDWLRCLHREVEEESAAKILKAYPLCSLVSDLSAQPQGLVMCSSVARLSDFAPTEEVSERCILSPEAFLQHYYGNVALMAVLLRRADFIA